MVITVTTCPWQSALGATRKQLPRELEISTTSYGEVYLEIKNFLENHARVRNIALPPANKLKDAIPIIYFYSIAIAISKTPDCRLKLYNDPSLSAVIDYPTLLAPARAVSFSLSYKGAGATNTLGEQHIAAHMVPGIVTPFRRCSCAKLTWGLYKRTLQLPNS